MDIIGSGSAGGTLDQRQIEEIVARAVDAIKPDGRRILAIIPDATRSCPLGQVMRILHARLAGRAKAFDAIIALGTHRPMNDQQIDKLLGVEPGRRGDIFPGMNVFNHHWDDPAALKSVGSLKRSQVEAITGGKFSLDVDVTVNKLIFDYDAVLIVGPVFPHEVVGFSGGCKYFFPGVSGAELLNFFHWLGAVITSAALIGVKHTPVRDVIETASDMLGIEKHALCMVVEGAGLAGLYFGPPRDAWSAAADLSSVLHVRRVAKPFASVLSQVPTMYDDLWTGGKGMYKLEPVVADGGELIIYAPHITELSITHGRQIEEIGYHVRDYFVNQWDRFKHYPWGVLAHSTHVRGVGTYVDGVERPRIRVTVASGISEAMCKKINLGYRDPATIRIADWQGKEDQGKLYVPKAGEMLYRLETTPDWQKM